MGTDNLFWKKKNRLLKRRIQNRGNPPEAFLIVCEGEKTEPNYFKAFKLSSASIKVCGCGYNSLSLVKKAIELKKKAAADDEHYDQIWCVFDKDDCTLANFNVAFDLARRQNIHIAYSNEAFELWYLLHFHFYDSAITRVQCNKKLSKLLGHSYRKNSIDMYDELLTRQSIAIKNAKKLLRCYRRSNPYRNNPSTTVYELVTQLNAHLHR